MTTQSILSGQSIGTGSNIGNGKFSIAPLTFGGTTTAYTVAVKLTNGTTGGLDKAQTVRVWFASCYATLTAAQALVQLRQEASYVDIRPSPEVAGIAIINSELMPVQGAKFYAWVDAPTYPTAGTLDVTLVESP